MTKLTLAVSKCYKNGGRFVSHRKKTKKAWKHCFLSNDYTENYKFGTEWVDSVTAQFLKLKKWHLRKFWCPECYRFFPAYVKNDRMKAICPYCPDDEDE